MFFGFYSVTKRLHCFIQDKGESSGSAASGVSLSTNLTLRTKTEKRLNDLKITNFMNIVLHVLTELTTSLDAIKCYDLFKML